MSVYDEHDETMTVYETHASQFGLISGTHQQHSDMVLLVEPATLFAPEARKGRLYVVAEVDPAMARGRDACDLAIRTIRKTFYSDSSYSVTASLRKAISAANHTLYQHNFNTVPQKRAVVGITCVVVKEHDLYIAQVAPGQAYLFSQDKLRAIPTNAFWTGGQHSNPVHVKPAALGSSLSVEPAFYRAVLGPGDTALLCTSNLAPMLSREELARLLHTSNAADVVKSVINVCKQNALADAHGIAISISPPLSQAAQAAPLSRKGASERGRLAMRVAGNRVAHFTSEVTLLVKGPLARRQQQKAEARRTHESRIKDGLARMPEELPPPPIPPIPTLDLGESLEERIAYERQERRTPFELPSRANSDEPLPPSSFLGESGYTNTPATSQRIDLSDTPSMAMLGSSTRRTSTTQMLPDDITFGERIAQTFDRLTDPIHRAGRRNRRAPPRAAPQMRRQPGLSYRREKPAFPWIQLLLLVALIALLIVYGRGQLNDNAQQEAVDSLTVAENAVAAIRNAPNDAAAAQQLDAAAVALTAVHSSPIVTATLENRKRLEAMQREYERAQAGIQKLTYFDDLTVIGQHPQAAAQATFSSLVIPPPLTGVTNTEGFSYIYALDSNQGVLYRMPKTGGSLEPYLSPSDVLEGSPVGKVKAMAWRIDNVVAIGQNEGGPSVYYFRENGKWRASILANSEDWTSTTKNLRLVTYEGNLYLWGAADGQILKYLSGRTSEPYDPWIKDNSVQKVATASDIAIDGSVYLLLPTGRVEILSANAFQREITVPTVKPPLDVVTAFFVTGNPDSGSIFMLDVKNDRVVQIDKQTGALIQQMTVHTDSPIQLKAISAIYVDAQNEQQPIIYLVNNSQIVRATLPSAPKPFRDQPTVVPSPVGSTATP